MPVFSPFAVYRDQLTSLYHGLALWKPNPPKAIYDKVSIGDVGYVREGVFIRMFNVMLPWDHKSNRKLGKPVPYKSLSFDEPVSCDESPSCDTYVNTLDDYLDKGEYCSLYVSTETNSGNRQAMVPDE